MPAVIVSLTLLFKGGFQGGKLACLSSEKKEKKKELNSYVFKQSTLFHSEEENKKLNRR